MERTYSISSFPDDIGPIIDRINQTGDPVFISRGSRAVAAIVDAETYMEDMQALRGFKKMFMEGNPARRSASDRRPDAAEADSVSNSAGRTAWRCTICGYIEYVDELPEGYTCPICNVGKELFEKITL